MKPFYATRARRYPRGWAVVVEFIERHDDGRESKRQVSVAAGLTLEQRDEWLTKVRDAPARYWHEASERRRREVEARRREGQASEEVTRARRERLESVRFVDDAEVQAWVAERPDGASLDEIGEFFGVSRERVRQLESEALRSLAMRLALVGMREAPTNDIVCWCDGTGWRAA